MVSVYEVYRVGDPNKVVVEASTMIAAVRKALGIPNIVRMHKYDMVKYSWDCVAYRKDLCNREISTEIGYYRIA